MRWIYFVLICFFIVGCETSTVILNNVTERDANEITLLLGSHGITTTKVPSPTAAGATTTGQNWDISVPSSQLTEALSLLNQSGLPRSKGTSLLDLFGSPGIVPSELQDRIRYQEGLSEQLASTIRKMDGVLDADVQITFPSETEVEKKPLTASVYIKQRGVLGSSNNMLITKIKRLVSSAIPGLTPENVTVVADRAVFTDVTRADLCADEQNMVSIWSIAMSQGSLFRFRLIFYIFIFVIFVLASLLVLMIWKFYPLITDPNIDLYKPEQISRETIIITPATPPATPPPPEEMPPL